MTKLLTRVERRVAGAVTHGAVRCSAWLGVAAVGIGGIGVKREPNLCADWNIGFCDVGRKQYRDARPAVRAVEKLQGVNVSLDSRAIGTPK